MTIMIENKILFSSFYRREDVTRFSYSYCANKLKITVAQYRTLSLSMDVVVTKRNYFVHLQ